MALDKNRSPPDLAPESVRPIEWGLFCGYGDPAMGGANDIRVPCGLRLSVGVNSMGSHTKLVGGTVNPAQEERCLALCCTLQSVYQLNINPH